jgi:hypothetical protein
MFTNHRNLYRKCILIAATTAIVVSVTAPHANAQLSRVGSLVTPIDVAKPVDLSRYAIPTYKESQPCSPSARGAGFISWKQQPQSITHYGIDIPNRYLVPTFEASLTGCSFTGIYWRSFFVADPVMQLDVIDGPDVWTGTQKSPKQKIDFFALADNGDYTVRATLWSAANPSVGATSTFTVHVEHQPPVGCTADKVNTAEIVLDDVDRVYDRTIETPLPIHFRGLFCFAVKTEGPRPFPNSTLVEYLAAASVQITSEDGTQIPVIFTFYPRTKAISPLVWSGLPAGSYTVKVSYDRNGIAAEKAGVITLV